MLRRSRWRRGVLDRAGAASASGALSIALPTSSASPTGAPVLSARRSATEPPPSSVRRQMALCTLVIRRGRKR
jgi:hypothetical protein